MDLPGTGLLELLYVEFVGVRTASAAPDLAASALATWGSAPGCLGVQCRLEQDDRRLLLLTCWADTAARDAWRASPEAHAWWAEQATRGARTARSVWKPDTFLTPLAERLA